MPTQKKIESVKRLAKMFEDSTIAISADFTGMDVGSMTALRKALRDNGIDFHVIKNSLYFLLIQNFHQRTSKKNFVIV